MQRKVLVVEDNAINRKTLRAILRREYEVLEAENGAEALAILHKKHKIISAVLLDIIMPVMDGFALLRAMRGNAVLAQIPVIVATGSSDEDAEVKALSLGANDFVTKPYNPVLISHCLRNTINLRETASIVNAIQRDKLSGLFNREAFFDRVGVLIREHEPGYYIMSCYDIDSFKVINDQYGAEEGDRILRHIGRVSGECFAAVGGICSRISADNFAALYPAGDKTVDYVTRTLDQRFSPPDTHATITYSVGRYVVGDLSLSASAIYDRAYLAKRSVKGRYDGHIAYFSESMREKLIREQEIIGDMDAALACDQFEIWFQPQFNHASGALIGAEALVRWRHPQKGLIPPDRFIPVFEQNGFIYEMDKYVWEQVCRCIRKWRAEGVSPLPVSVNVSRYDVFRADFFATITGLVEKYGIPVDMLRLEITESAFAKSAEQIISMVKRLLDYGFTIEIDDFGSGYSSLNTLKDVPATVLKLDMKFFEGGGNTRRGGNIVESVVRMAKWLGMTVVAEGVESKAQADYLKSIGCYYIQGYLYAQPMPAHEYEALAHDSAKEARMVALETVENLDNDSFWDPTSMDTLIFNSFVGGACVFEYHNGRIELLRANDKYAREIGSAGMTVEDALRLDWSQHLDEPTRARIWDAMQSSIASGATVTEELLFSDLPGCPEETYLRSTMRVIASYGDHYLVYCTNENTTAQHQAEQKERLTATHLKAIMDNIDGGVTACVFTDGQPRILMANDKYYALLGYTREQYEKEARDVYALIHPEDRASLAALAMKTYREDGNAQAEYRIIRRDGSLRWVRAVLSSTAFAEVEAPVQLSVFSDITVQKDAEQKLRETDEQLRFLNETAHELLAQPDGEKALAGLLQKLLDYFAGDRAYIFELDYEKCLASNTYEACAAGVAPEKDKLQAVTFEACHFWLHAFDQRDFIDIADVAALDEGRAEERRILSAQNIRSLIAVPLQRDGRLIGFIGIDNPRQQHARLDRLAALGDYLAVMLTRRDLEAKILGDNKTLVGLMNDTPGGFVRMRVHPDGAITPLYFNDGFLHLVGMNREELFALYGADALAGVHPDDVPLVRETVARMLKDGAANSPKYRLRGGEGGYVRVMFYGRATKDDAGATYLNIFYTDASEKPGQTPAYGELLGAVLSTVIAASPDLAFVKDRDYRYICCNSAFARAAGLESARDIVGKTDYDLVDRQFADQYRLGEEQLVQNGLARLNYEEIMPTKDGSVRYANTSKCPLLDEAGHVVGIYAVTRDVTAARDADTQLRLLTESIPGGLATYACTLDSLRLTYFNDGFCKLFGFTREEYELKSETDPITQIFSEDLPILRAHIAAIVRDGTPFECLYRAHVRGGGYKWINHRAAVAERLGETVYVNAVLLDVTQRQEALERLRISEEEHRLAVEHSGNVICRFNVATRTLSMSAENAAKLSLPAEATDVPDGPIRAGMVAPDSVQAYVAFFAGIARGEKAGTMTFQSKTPAGWRWLEGRYSTIFAGNERPISAVVSFYDVTEQMEKEAVYKKWQQSLKEKDPASYTLFRCNLSRDASFDTVEGSLLRVNFQAGAATFNERTREYVEQCVCLEDRERYATLLNSDTLLANYYRGKRAATLEYREQLPEGGLRWLRLLIDLVEYPNSAEVEAYLMYENIDDSKRAELLTLERAENDALTGVFNRATFVMRAEQKLREARPGARHALLMLDVDGFKMVNDVFGHGAGDQALIDTAAAMRATLRRDDLVGRLGGDEFVAFLSDIPNDAVAADKARQMCALTRKSFSLEVQISASIGVVVAPRDGMDFETLYKKADAALYHVKGSGKDAYAFYREDMNDEHLLPEEEPSPGADAAHKEKKRRMLIVDDSQIDHEMLSNIFKDDFIIEKARDGNSALIRLRHYGSAISVVLLDLLMPGMDGFAVLEKMQSHADLRTIPVIVVSGEGNRETSLRAIRAGATDYVSKPVDAELLRIRVLSAISKAENERLRAQNSFLELQSDELSKYRTVLEGTATALVEYDWVRGEFRYDPTLPAHIAGVWDKRPLWRILLADAVADGPTVEKMQALVHDVAEDRKRRQAGMELRLKTPDQSRHRFHMRIFKRVNEYRPTDKLVLAFNDLDEAPPTDE